MLNYISIWRESKSKLGPVINYLVLHFYQSKRSSPDFASNIERIFAIFYLLLFITLLLHSILLLRSTSSKTTLLYNILFLLQNKHIYIPNICCKKPLHSFQYLTLTVKKWKYLENPSFSHKLFTVHIYLGMTAIGALTFTNTPQVALSNATHREKP